MCHRIHTQQCRSQSHRSPHEGPGYAVTVSPVPSPKPVESILRHSIYEAGNASKTYDMKTEKPRIRAIALDQFGKSMAAKIRYRTTSLGGQAKVSGNGRVTFTKPGKSKTPALGKRALSPRALPQI